MDWLVWNCDISHCQPLRKLCPMWNHSTIGCRGLGALASLECSECLESCGGFFHSWFLSIECQEHQASMSRLPYLLGSSWCLAHRVDPEVFLAPKALKPVRYLDNVLPSALSDTKEEIILWSTENFALLYLMGPDLSGSPLHIHDHVQPKERLNFSFS